VTTAPATYRLREWADGIVNGDAILCDIGNSLVSDNASAPPLGRGVRRCWHPRLGWSGVGGRFVQGPAPWVTDMHGAGATTATVTSKSTAWPGTGEVGISPITYTAMHSTFNLPNNRMFYVDLTDPRKAGVESGAFIWADGKAMKGRLLHHINLDATITAHDAASAGMLPFSIKKRRATVESGALVAAVVAGAAGTSFVEVDLGSDAGLPGISVYDTPGQNEDTKYGAIGGAMFYRVDGSGNRVPGLVYYDAATGGDKSTDVISQFDGTVVPKKYMAGFFEAMGPGGQWPTHIRLYAPTQNEHSAENTDFALGTYGVAKANILAIIDAVNALYDLYGKPRPKILIDSGHQTGYTNAKTILKELACYEAAQERLCHYMSTFQLGPKNASDAGAVTFYTNPPSDAVHFGIPDTTEAKGNGESIMAAAQWGAMVMSVDAPTRPRIAQYAA